MQNQNISIPESISFSNISAKVSELVTFESFFMFGVIYIFILWITLILWVTMDVSSRSANILFQLMSILFVTILGPLGFLLYLIIRPTNAIHKKFLGEIEENLAILGHIVEGSKKGLLFCPKCSHKISHTSKICPKCKENLTKKCDTCKRIVLHGWKNCPFCSEKIKKKKKKKKK